MLALPRKVIKEIRIGPAGLELPTGTKSRKKLLEFFPIILDSALSAQGSAPDPEKD